MGQTSVRLPDELLAAIDAEAARVERSRGWVIRKAAEAYLQAAKTTSPCTGFTPQSGNALRCVCGKPKREHR